MVREHDLPLFRAVGEFLVGWATADGGAPADGLAAMRRGAESPRQQNALVFDGIIKIALAEAEAGAGDPDRAIAILDEALATVDRTGYRAFEAELHRARGEILLKRDPASPAPAEEAFLTALAVAKQQAARSFELRGALALAKLYQSTSRPVEAYSVLAPALQDCASSLLPSGRRSYGAATRAVAPSSSRKRMMECPMQRNDLSKSLVAFDQHSTLVVVVELSLKSWLVAGLVPGLTRQPLKKLGADEEALVALVDRWRAEAVKAGGRIERIVVGFEAGRDGFWLARFLRERGIEAYVIHPTSIPVPREHRRAKTDRLDTGLLMRALLGWLRGEAKHCSMAATPSLAEEDAKRPSREHEKLGADRTRIMNKMKAALIRLGVRGFKVRLRQAAERLGELRTPEGLPIPPHTLAELHRDLARLGLIAEQIKEIESERRRRLRQAPEAGTHPMLLMLARLKSIGVETADMLVHEVFYRRLRDRRAVARYGGMTGAPTRAAPSDATRDWPEPATPGCAKACCNWPGAGSCSRKTAP